MFDFEINTYFGPVATDNNDSLIPEVWAQESLAILEENMVAAQLVHRDFESEFARFGDVVNTRRPREFAMRRKNDTEDVTVQSAITDNVPVRLNQHGHVSFTIKDGEETLSMKELINLYLNPAVLAMARGIDRVVSSQFVHFMFAGNHFGRLGTSPTKNTVLGVRNVLNKNKAYPEGRRMLLTPDSETDLLSLDAFTDADRVGDEGTALREAALGKKLGFNMWMAQNQPSVATGTSKITASDLDGNVAKGDTVISVTDGTNYVVGQFITIAGEDVPHLVVGKSTNDLTIWPAVTAAALDEAVVSGYTIDTIDQTSVTEAAGGDGSNAGYREGWHGWIHVDATPGDPEVGQIVVFGGPTSGTAAAAAAKYVIIDVDADNDKFMVDRPLEAAVADGATVSFGPIGQYNFAFNRAALALVTRPLKPPKQGTGALSAIGNFNDLAMRVTITYEGRGQGHLVTLDLLFGVAVLDLNLGAVMLG